MTDMAPEWVAERERGNPHLLRVMSWIAKVAPGFVTDPLIWLISLYFTIFPSKTSAAASTAYLGKVLGRPAGFSERHRHVRMFAQVILDRVHLLGSGVLKFDVRSRNHELIETRHLEGRGGVLLSAHFGSFEVLRAFERTLPGLDVRYLMFPDNAQNSGQILNQLNPEVAAKVISLSDGHAAMLEVREALEANVFVAFLGDRMPVRSPQAEVAVEFFGDQVHVPVSPYLSAILAGVPLILCFAPRVGRKTYEIEMFEIYDGAPVPRGQRDKKCHELAQAYADYLEKMCRRYPYNWFNFYDFWSR
jgi:predicted LPLAT superfamily acyltransferase